MTIPHRRFVLATAAAGAVVAVLSGCGGGGGADPGPEPGSPRKDTSPPASSAPASPEAADGTDLDQCSDANCEVVVHKGDEIPMDGTQGLERLVVDAADEEQVSLRGTGPGTMVNGSVGAPYSEGPVLKLNGIDVSVVSAGPDHAVIKLSLPQ